ncbi:MAG: type I pullulanase [Lachnospiraceae bacterium]|nr:type I pullulanase [Lachnospiraceae bacterium]
MNVKKMFKSVLGVMLALVLMLASAMEFGPIVTAEAAGEVTVRFHFQKAGGVGNLQVYTWLPNQEGKHHPFTSTDDFGSVYTQEVASTVSQMGFIITDTSWNKDYAEDRFVDLSKVTSGYVDVYISSGNAAFATFTSSNGVVPFEVINASIKGLDEIEAVFTKKSDNPKSDIKVYDKNDNEIAIDTVTYSSGTKAVIKLAKEIDLGSAYTVKTVDGNGEATARIDFNSEYFEEAFTYEGNDLGANYTKAATTFKVWAPTADAVNVLLFSSGQVTKVDKGTYKMTGGTSAEKGVWTVTVNKNLKNIYYLYQVTVNGKTVLAMDPYARTGDTTNDNPVESNYYVGQRGMVVDLKSTNPKNWNKDKRKTLENNTDAIIYETSVRDFSSDADSGIAKKYMKKYLAFTQTNTKNSKGTKTGITYVKNLGVTHIQLMPTFDFSGTEEKSMTNYNWGYNPVNYNIPEGAFSTNPTDGNVRVNEYKRMVQSIHSNGMGVSMDVVYNHVNNATTFSFNKIVPGYFFRGSNGSGCGNDVASERSMVSKYIVDSVAYWAEEYHLDAFRFDLVGLLDVETMNAIRKAVDEIDPNIMLYGEGWTLGTSTTRNVALATQPNTSKMDGVGMFNDVIRDAIGGSNDGSSKGYATGNPFHRVSDLKYAIKSSTYYNNDPNLNINYLSCHDNYTLWDKITKSNPGLINDTKVKMNKLAAAINFTSQGIPLFLSGEEFLRTKNGDHNSYMSPDSVNLMDWSLVDDNKDVVSYYKGLIAFRKMHKGLRMTSEAEINKNLKFISSMNNVIAYTIDAKNVGDISDKILVAFNPNSSEQTLTLPTGKWQVCVNGKKAGNVSLATVSGKLKMDGYSAYVLVQGKVNTISGAKVSNIKNVAVTGKAVKQPSLKVVLEGKTLTQGKDYTVTYKNNKKIGKASFVVKGKGCYKGYTKTYTFKITPAKVKLSNVKAGKKRATVTWKKAKGAQGYQVYMSTSKSGKYKQVKAINKSGTVKFVKKNLKKGKTYYFKVRAYKKVSGKTYLGSFSTVKSVRVK